MHREGADGQHVRFHMSGHEEGECKPGYGWPDRLWEEEAQKLWQAFSLCGTVRIPRIGEEFPL